MWCVSAFALSSTLTGWRSGAAIVDEIERARLQRATCFGKSSQSYLENMKPQAELKYIYIIVGILCGAGELCWRLLWSLWQR